MNYGPAAFLALLCACIAAMNYGPAAAVSYDSRFVVVFMLYSSSVANIIAPQSSSSRPMPSLSV